MNRKKTLVIGATTNSGRTAYTAIHRLVKAGQEVVLIGIKKGEVAGIPIQHGMPHIDDVDTVTLYIGPDKQEAYYDYLLSLNPNRIIFNPGTENLVLSNLATKAGIEASIACTLVLLATQQY